MKISLKIENMECQLSLNDLIYLVGSIQDILRFHRDPRNLTIVSEWIRQDA